MDVLMLGGANTGKSTLPCAVVRSHGRPPGPTGLSLRPPADLKPISDGLQRLALASHSNTLARLPII